ncbi:unnamed protein product [Allacma fusca]|uniref:Uncharacterized protein n=1 Tax=Allacma fusca TaxID=39272 RepID=A0A8J2LSC2_9HEXA|nr:unnamed protein product [Allacma fusca]
MRPKVDMNESGGTMRVPKGILKNSGRSNNVSSYETAPASEGIGLNFGSSAYGNQPTYMGSSIPHQMHGYPPPPHMYPMNYNTGHMQPVMPVQMNPHYRGDVEVPHWGMNYEHPVVPEPVLLLRDKDSYDR